MLVILHDYMSLFVAGLLLLIITTFKCLTWILLAPNANLQKSFTPIPPPPDKNIKFRQVASIQAAQR